MTNLMDMYKYKLIEQEESKAKNFQEERIRAFDVLENKLDELKKLLRQSKIETIKYYRNNPQSFSVVVGTDLITDYFKDIETLLKSKE